MRRNLRLLLLLIPATALLSARRVATVRSDILRVQAGGCAGDRADRVGTGFAWHSDKEIVTALHVVAGCQKVTLYSERDQTTYSARIVRVLRRADLALVQVQDQASFPPIAELATPLTANADLTAWGYGEGIPAMRDFRSLRVANGSPTLQQNIPTDVANDLRRAGSPALDLTVVPIDAPLAPGLSGAPLLDASGRVRAIADGGVAHGITHVSWAIPVQYLVALLQSTEGAATVTAPNANLSAAEVTRAEVFSADYVAQNTRSIKCGTARLRFARTRSLSEAQIGNDSPLGLQQLTSFFGGAPPSLSFDVYEDAGSGATIALPAGARIQPQGEFACRASLLNGQIDMIVSVTAIPPGSTPDVISGQFEMFVAAPPMQSWMPDPSWSYLTPFFRPDGLIVKRKAFAHFVPNPFNVPTEYLFETLAVRNGTFVGVAAIRRNDLNLMLCQRGAPPQSQCPPMNYMPQWAHVALSVQLATFAISAGNSTTASWQQTGAR